MSCEREEKAQTAPIQKLKMLKFEEFHPTPNFQFLYHE